MGIKENIQELIERVGKKNLAIAFVVVIAIVSFFLFFFPGMTEAPTVGEVKAVFTIVDEQGQALAGITVKYLKEEGEWGEAKTDSKGKIILSAPKNSVLSVKIDALSFSGKDFYEFTNEYEFLEEDFVEQIKLVKKVIVPTGKTILLQSYDGAIPAGSVTASFLCEASGESWQATNSINGSIISTEAPLNCGNVVAKIISAAFEDLQVNLLEKDAQKTAQLKKKTVPPGTLVVVVVDEAGNAVTGKNFLVTVYGSLGQQSEKNSNGYGDVSFSLSPAEYTVTVKDTTGEFASGNAGNILVESGKQYSANVIVSKAPKGTIIVSVKDKDNKQEIKNAEVILKDAKGNIYAQENTGEEGKTVVFIVSDLQAYSVFGKKEGAINEGYFPVEQKITVEELEKNPSIELLLEKITSLNTGVVNVKVVDEDFLPVKNARVMFMVAGSESDGSKDYLLETSIPENDMFTDVNGEVEFVMGGVEEIIYPYVVKYPAIARDRLLAKPILLEGENKFDVVMTIGDSVIELEVVSKETGKAIDNASYEVFKVTGEPFIAGERPVFGGKDSFTAKADSKIFLKIKAPGHTTFFSQAMQLWPSQTFNIKAELSPEYQLGYPVISFEGIFNEMGTSKAEAMKVGENYRARMRMILPSKDKVGEALGNALIHFRVGESFTVENDSLYIYGTAGESVLAPANPLVEKYTTFSEENNGVEKKTEGKAKFVSISWSEPEAGEYLVDVLVTPVKALEKLPIFYRVQVSTVGNRYLRDPLDAVLGEDLEVSGKKSLYAQTYAVDVIYEGSVLTCETGGEEFCFGGEKLLGHIPNIGDDLEFIGSSPFELSNYSEYEYSFNITNIQKQVYNEMKLILNIKNEALELLDYKFTNADGDVIEVGDSGLLDPYHLELTDLGAFGYNKQVQVYLKFKTKKKIASDLDITLIADQKIRFNHKTQFKVVSDKEMVLSVVEPKAEILAAFTPQLVTIKVNDAKEGLLLNGVKLIAELRDPELPDAIWKAEAITGSGEWSNGIAQFYLPPGEPFSKVIMTAFLVDYVENGLELIVDDKIIEWEPEALNYEMDVKTKKESDEAMLSVKNRTGIELQIVDAEIVGYFKGIINLEKMNNYITETGQALSFASPLTLLQAQENEESKLITKAFLEEEAGAIMAQEELAGIAFNMETDGAKIILSVENIAMGLQQSFEVPLQIAVSFGEAPTNACLLLTGHTIDLTNWSQGLEGSGKAEIGFDIENDCFLEEQPVNLEGLQFELVPDGEMAGNIDIVVLDPELGAQKVSDTLIPNKKTNYIFNVEHAENGKQYVGTLSFNPKQFSKGKITKFELFVRGLSGVGGESKTSLATVQANPEKISAQIANINLSECINLNDGARVDLKTIDEEIVVSLKNSCALTEVELRFCHNDKYCAGIGNIAEGGLELLGVSDSDKTITLPAPSAEGIQEKTIRVKIMPEGSGNKILGLYGISVEAKTPFSKGVWQPIGEIPVEILSDETDELELSEYDYYLTTEKSQQEEPVSLKNYMYLQRFSIKANECDWDEFDPANISWVIEHETPLVIGGALSTGTVVLLAAIAAGASSTGIGIVVGVSIVAAMIIIAVIIGCDTDEYETFDGFIDYLFKLGNQWPPTDPAFYTPSDMESCSLLLGNEEWKGNCLQCIAKENEDKAIVPKVCEADFNSDSADLEMQLAWYGQELTELGTVTGKGIEGTQTIEVLDAKIKKVGDKRLSPKAMYGLLKIEGTYDLVMDPNEALKCKYFEDSQHNENIVVNENGIPTLTTEERDDGFNYYYIGTDKEHGSCNASQLSMDEGLERSFHLKFNAFEAPAKILVPELQRCHGTKEGITGKEALPKILFNWDWSGTGEDGKDSIEWNSCDANNENYIYCDATQFSIMATKRMNLLQEFFKENNNAFECPKNWQDNEMANTVAKQNEEKSSKEIKQGSIGLKSLTIDNEYLKQNKKIKAALEMENKDGNISKIKVKFTMKDPKGNTSEQEKTITIQKGKNPTVEPVYFDASELGVYIVVAIIIEPVSLISTENSLIAFAYYSDYEEGKSECFLPFSTAAVDNIVILEYFINENVPGVGQYVADKYKGENPAISYPNDWKANGWNNIDFVRSLVSFNALLIKDNYSEDFQQDFANYYTTTALLDAPDYFAGKNDNAAFADYFTDLDKMYFGRMGLNKSASARKIFVPGKYYVNLAATFEKEKGWKFFEDKEPIANIEVLFKKIQPADPAFIFYYLPFDGEVGKNTENGRQDYGIDYVVDLEDDIYLTASVSDKSIKLEKISDSSLPLVQMELAKEEDLARLNARSDTRGDLLEVKMSNENKAKMVFSPNNFAPAVMKVSKDSISDEPVTAEYSLLDEGAQAVNTGSNLTYWYGLGPCYDFAGNVLKEQFNMSTDQHSTLDIVNYALEWDSVQMIGDVYLATIFYLPPNRNYLLKAKYPKNEVKFINSAEDAVEVNEYELQSPEVNLVKHIADVFEGVEKQDVCVNIASNGEMHFWWNPKKVLEEASKIVSGTQMVDVNAVEQKIVNAENGFESELCTIE